jgi:hypothetical protein
VGFYFLKKALAELSPGYGTSSARVGFGLLLRVLEDGTE